MDEHREGTQAEESIPPWEQPGCFRRDCEPHRGTLLWWLAFASLFLGVLALLPCWDWLFGLVGIPLGLCSRYLAKADLANMQAGLMDPAGEGDTALAMNLSTIGLRFGIAGTVFWGGLFIVAWWILGRPPM